MKSVYAAVLLVFFSACVPKDYCETEYPIMLVPGISGFDTLMGVLDMWYQIPENLSDGGAVVRCATLSAFNTAEVRGEQLLVQVEDFLAETGADKVNLIGHSQGAPAARYVAHVSPGLVASVTSAAGGNREVPFDVIDLNELTAYQEYLFDLVFAARDLLGDIYFNGLGGTNWPQDSKAMAYSILGEELTEFNNKYPHGMPKADSDPEGEYYAYVPDDDGVQHFMRFYSWTGAAPGFTNPLDLADALFVAYGGVMDALITEDFEEKAGDVAHEQDGMVPVWSARFGKVIREDYHWNHLDAVNNMFGLISPFASNPIAVFRQHANRLQQDGL